MRLNFRNKSILLFFLLLGTCNIFLLPKVLGQLPDFENKISVSYQNQTLENIIEDLSKNEDIRFSYSSKTIPAKQKLTYSASNKSISLILDEIFEIAEIQYEIIGGYLVLSKLDDAILPPEPPKPKKYTVSGIITDAKTNEVLIGAAIYNKETGTGTLSNPYGFFSLTLAEGTYNLETSYLGYSIEGRTVDLTKNIRWNIKLAQVNSMLEEIVITSFDREELIFTSLAAQNNVSSFEVEQKNSALGETDMLRSLGNLPGVSFQNEGSSYFNVRGGARDQNLILLDEATIYNPSHFLGLFTPIIPEAVKHTEVYKADFPIQYGGRLSSVIDIRTRDGDMQKFSGSGSIGLVATRMSFEGPLKKNSSSYFVSFRRSHLGMFIKKAAPNIDEFFFSDFTSKFNFTLGKRDRLYLTLYSGKDKFISSANIRKEGLEWGNNSITLRWNHIYGTRLFSNTTFYTSKYDYFLHFDYKQNTKWNSHISSSNLKSEFSYFINPNNSFKFGVNLGAYFFNPGEYNVPNLGDEYQVSTVNSSELVLYGGGEHKLTTWLNINYGIRLSNWSDYGEAYSVLYDGNYNPIGYKNYRKGEQYYSSLKAEPRVSVSFKTGIYSSLKASYNRTIQHINLINNSISPFNSLEVWLPSGPNIKPQYANIYNLGYLISFPDANIDIQSDIYYKQLYNQIGYQYHAKMLLNPYIEGEIRQGKGIAYGYEVFVKKKIGKLTGQLGYSFTRSKLKINDINGSREYYSRQDKPIDFSFLVEHQLKPRLSININFFYSSGIRYTTPSSFYYYRGSQVPIYTEQNNEKLPDYKRVDLGTNIRLNKVDKKSEHYLSINIYNFFATKNPILLNFTKTNDTDGKPIVPANKYNYPEISPTYRYVYSFVPSITYYLKF